MTKAVKTSVRYITMQTTLVVQPCVVWFSLTSTSNAYLLQTYIYFSENPLLFLLTYQFSLPDFSLLPYRHPDLAIQQPLLQS